MTSSLASDAEEHKVQQKCFEILTYSVNENDH